MCLDVRTQKDVDDWIAKRGDYSNYNNTNCLHVHCDVILENVGSKPFDVFLEGKANVRIYDGTVNYFRGDGSGVAHFYGSTVANVYGGNVEAYDLVSLIVRAQAKIRAGSNVVVRLEGCTMPVEGGIIRQSNQAQWTPEEWAQNYGVKTEETEDGTVLTVFKCVDSGYYSQFERAYKRTCYAPGSNPIADDWHERRECGGGLHFSPTPVHADKYVGEGEVTMGSRRYLACTIPASEAVPLDDKIKARRVLKSVEVDRFGRILEDVPVGPRFTAELLEKARLVPRYQGQPNAAAIRRDLGVSQTVAASLAYEIKKES